MEHCKFGTASSDGAPPLDQNVLNFMQSFWKMCMLAPSYGRLAPPPTKNPGSASGLPPHHKGPYKTDTKKLPFIVELVYDIFCQQCD